MSVAYAPAGGGRPYAPAGGGQPYAPAGGGRPYAEVIGDPIAQSKSPAIHGFWLGRLGIDATYRARHVRSEDLAAYIAARRADPLWRGCNVTMPHKQAVMLLCDILDPLAARAGAVNTVVRAADGTLCGHNTDVAGFLVPLAAPPPRSVSVVGAGGAARAVLVALAAHPPGLLVVQNRSLAKAQALLAEFGLEGLVVMPGAEIPTVQLLVNASALGMAGHPSLPPVERYVSDGGTVFDIVTHPVETALLLRARARGLHTIDGLAMLIGQAAAAFALFFGAKPPREAGDAQLRALLLA